MRIAFALIVCAALASPSLSQHNRAPRPSQPDFRQGVARAQDRAKKGDAYRQLFTHASSKQLDDLTRDKDIGISLQAAWEQSRRIVRRYPPVDGLSAWMYDPAYMRSFCRFLAQRTNTPVPDWWQTTLEQNSVFPGKSHRFVLSLPETPGSDPTVAPIPPGALDGSGRLRRYSLQGRTYDVSSRGSYADGWPDSVVFLQSPDRVFIGPFSASTAAYPFKLFCFDTSGKPRWAAPVWAAQNPGAIAGEGMHRVSIQRRADQISVFGADSGGVYAECFRVSDGQPVFRFCTSYWARYSESWKTPWGHP